MNLQQTVFEMMYSWVDKLVSNRLKQAPFDKSYSGVISDVLFEPDTPINDSLFGTYKIKYGIFEKVVKLNDSFVHEIGERINVYVYKNEPEHVVVEPIIKYIPPNLIEYIDQNISESDKKANKEKYKNMNKSKIAEDLFKRGQYDKFIEFRDIKTNGKIYTTKHEFRLAVLNKNDDNEEVLAMHCPNGRIIEFKNWFV